LGRIAALFFGKRVLKDPKESYRMGTAVFFYALLGLFPAVFLLVSTVEAFAVTKIMVLICLLAITIYSGLTWREPRKL
jgi:C4-dicarboxylate transporter